MSNEIIPNSSSPVEAASEPATESFGELLAQFEHSHSHKVEGGARQLEGIVVSVDAESVYLDIGFKAEGVLPRSAFENNAEGIAPADKFPVSVKGRNLEGYYELSRLRVTLPTDWSSLEEAFAQKSAVVGIVTGVVKGGLTWTLVCALLCRLTQRRPRCRGDGEAGRSGNYLPHHQARCDR